MVFIFLLAAGMFNIGCNSWRPSQSTNDDVIPAEVIALDTLEIAPEEPTIRRKAKTKVHDLIHTRLDVSFDWKNKYLNGKATLTLKPWFYPSDRLLLDAQGMTIHMIVNTADNSPIDYTYDGKIIDIQLPKKYSRFEKYTIAIDYTARPDELEVTGGYAITDARGLYFINPDSSIVGKPTQVWTQGQPEANSVWFPTIDSPNERMTQEIFIRVRKEFQTLSNGTLIYSNYHDDGTRTDYWKQDLDHPPYLTMIAAGDFLAAQDTWTRKDGSSIPVTYYLERDYAPYAWKIFGNTPEMLTFFSDLLGVEYPWEKYAQIIVRDYVSGAMENTTAVIHGEFLNMTDRELLDYDFEEIIAHELFHHWFGDMVTCEDWSHLPLNESFATYGEYLWEEFKYGRDAADYHGWVSEQGYLYEARFKQVPLIRFDYRMPDEMFDAHSYNKGGRVLHMLRETVGDTAFFASLQHYLSVNAFKDVEIEHLRLAFERVCGKDMSTFFTQWFSEPGHPELNINYFYDEEKREQQVIISQTQDTDRFPVYNLPMQIDLHFEGETQTHEVVMNEREQLFTFQAERTPKWVNVDARRALLCERNDIKPHDWWQYQLTSSGPYKARKEALDYFAENYKKGDYPIIEQALDDPFWDIRLGALDLIADLDSLSEAAAVKVLEIARKEKDTETRGEAIRLLSRYQTENANLTTDEIERMIKQERSFNVYSAAIEALYVRAPEKGLKAAREALAEHETPKVMESASGVLLMNGDPKDLELIERRIEAVEGYGRFVLLQNYKAMLQALPLSYSHNGLQLLDRISANPEEAPWMRFALYDLLGSIRERLSGESESIADLSDRSLTLLERYIANETEPRFITLLQSFR